ncbi:MAG: sigma-70 family RNA polymerase sigma factor, partial [Ignavibacteria bacterium]|nr:sigma-70 family RNA polymerase sigma factor [Ignavibacteria bacterium]
LIKRNKKIIDIDIDNDKSDLLHIDFETDKIIDHKILKSGLCKCLSNLKIKYREAIILFYFDNLKYDQISEILHIPTSTVGIRIRRGKIMLKKICQDSGVKYE